MLRLQIVFDKLIDGVIAFIDIQLEPHTRFAFFGDTNSRSKSPPMVSARSITRQERGNQPISKTALCPLVGLGHLRNDL